MTALGTRSRLLILSAKLWGSSPQSLGLEFLYKWRVLGRGLWETSVRGLAMFVWHTSRETINCFIKSGGSDGT